MLLFIGYIVGGTAKNNTSLIVGCAFIGFVSHEGLSKTSPTQTDYFRVPVMPNWPRLLFRSCCPTNGDIQPLCWQILVSTLLSLLDLSLVVSLRSMETTCVTLLKLR